MSNTSVPRVMRRPPPLLGALLRFGWLRVRARMAEAIRAEGFADLQDAHLSLFQYPGPDGRRPSDLARQTRMSRQATNHLLGQLEAWGYIIRRAASGDERRLVYLTPRGRTVIRTLRRAVRAFERDLAREIGTEPFAVFINVLQVCAARGAATEAGVRVRRALRSRRPRPRPSVRG